MTVANAVSMVSAGRYLVNAGMKLRMTVPNCLGGRDD